jgi:predicted transglutaminase-like cysteine proteinase
MSNLRQPRRTAALFAIGLGLGMLASAGHTQADEFERSLFDPYPTFLIGTNAYQLASLTPFEIPQKTSAYRSSEPFGAEISALVKSGLQNKWASVKKKLPHERKVFMRCRADATTCPPAAQRFLAIVDKALKRDGWARVAEINRAINLNIRPVDDMTQYGVVDLWATPLMAFASNAGDCEDYAIAKYVALQEIGITDDDLRLVVVHDRATNEDHAVAAVRYDGRWQILDNRMLAIRQDVDIAEFNPLFMIDSEGVKRMTTSASMPQNAKTVATPATMELGVTSGALGAPRLL